MYAIKQFFKLLFNSILFWSFAFCSFIIIRYYGRNQEQVHTAQLNDVVTASEYLIFGVVLGVMVAIIYTIIEFLFDKFFSKILHLGFILLFKSFIYFIFLIFSLTFIAHLAEAYIKVDFPNERGWWVYNKVFWVVTIYFIFCSLLFSFMRLTNDKFGKGVIFKMIIGRYRNPREVERVLMFIDLKSSTAIAEKLGHLKYSRFIQDCFYYLNRIVNKYDAEIYQYVGDEAVLSWSLKKGVNNLNCVNLFFDYENKLNRHSKYYMKKYGVVPEFKAGIHAGKIIIAEVGTIKKELAYHGDVINTTSRIQEMCNEYSESLLVSEEFLAELNLANKYKAIPLGDELLDGKTEAHRLYAIQKN
ncbi:adenylate/guanylate cyclase domain-containing protein [Subsaximicrobium wynnwilliamsii]|uniref:Adenylate/guanylate cyclase domain-containing protein n=1 Tax=Subsaximicrobium wynnwilliamsii TaxID=291179 RepID=A0A5C6ZD14_9FLAO|nr:adenylate/guanylate cyclase domain-containing protein [Subsaximicrobium wynnwilliamsii]TXD86972.1 adenylate/guanylate cyclase domain-containing protein [Subsaximicrobium wynnwilliamsii]TXE00592.1 adenylate/guanylate cyclase domain-containing protein [Subsaximicrobium wynnwilliamsii]